MGDYSRSGVKKKNRTISRFAPLPINTATWELSSITCRCVLQEEVLNSSFMADVESSQTMFTEKKAQKHKKSFLFGSFFFFYSPEEWLHKPCGMCWKWTKRQMRGRGASEDMVACCWGSQGEGHRRNSPWSSNGKTSRPKEVGSPWKDGEWEGRREGGWGDKRKNHY